MYVKVWINSEEVLLSSEGQAAELLADLLDMSPHLL